MYAPKNNNKRKNNKVCLIVWYSLSSQENDSLYLFYENTLNLYF